MNYNTVKYCIEYFSLDDVDFKTLKVEKTTEIMFTANSYVPEEKFLIMTHVGHNQLTIARSKKVIHEDYIKAHNL